jgi:pimeloyl-ACP methyl ester carboxylesterase
VSRLGLQILAAGVFALAWTQFSVLEPKQESGILPIQPPTPYMRYFGDRSAGPILVIHGLDTSKQVMHLISAALADSGFEVYAIDLPGHGDSSVGFQTDLAQQAIWNAKRFIGDKTIVLGHSLGAGLLLDLAATEQFTTMVLLAPPPVPIANIHANRVLIAAGEFDFPPIRGFMPIATDIGEGRADLWVLPWGGHSAPILNPRHISRIVEWIGGEAGKTRTVPRILWVVLMFCAAVTVGVAFLPARPAVQQIRVPAKASVVRYITGCGGALLLLKVANPVSWLRLFATDYLIGFLSVSGLLLLALAGGRTTGPRTLRAGPYIIAILAAVFVIAVPGLIVAGRILDMSLSDGRWWRFPSIAAATLPLFLADEITIRRIHPRWKSDAIALLTRGLFLASLLTGVLTLHRESEFLVLIVPLITIFWIALWFATGVVHRHTQSPLAAALFATLVQGWAFASWFVTI